MRPKDLCSRMGRAPRATVRLRAQSFDQHGGARGILAGSVDGDPIATCGFRFEQLCVRALNEALRSLVEGKSRNPEGGGHSAQTLLLRTGRGATPDDARRDALSQLTLVYGSPVEPPPSPIISQKPSYPPPPTVRPSATAPAARGWLARLVARLRGV